MKCGKAIRELLWLSRFGELGPSSQPHLDHLAGCPSCRDEVGFDRAMVQQLRIALAERIEMAQPSPHAWEAILERAQRPEPRRAAGLWQWSAALVGRLRFATAMAGTGLAVILALNMEVTPLSAPQETDASVESAALQQVPRIPAERTGLVAFMLRSEAASASATRPDPEAALTYARPVAAQRPVAGTDDGAPTQTQLRVTFRPLQTPDPHRADVIVRGAGEGDSIPTSGSVPGEPS